MEKELNEGTDELLNVQVNLKDEKTGLSSTYSFEVHLYCYKKFNVNGENTFEYSWSPLAPRPRISSISNRGEVTIEFNRIMDPSFATNSTIFEHETYDARRVLQSSFVDDEFEEV